MFSAATLIELAALGVIVLTAAVLPRRFYASALWRAVPGVRDRVLTETGEVREHVQVFVGFESIRFTGGLATAVPEDAEIHIVPAVSGG